MGDITVCNTKNSRNICSQIIFIRTIQKFPHYAADHIIADMCHKSILFISQPEQIQILDQKDQHQCYQQEYDDLHIRVEMHRLQGALDPGYIFLNFLDSAMQRIRIYNRRNDRYQHRYADGFKYRPDQDHDAKSQKVLFLLPVKYIVEFVEQPEICCCISCHFFSE